MNAYIRPPSRPPFFNLFGTDEGVHYNTELLKEGNDDIDRRILWT